jgi:subtilase family serine protease
MRRTMLPLVAALGLTLSASAATAGTATAAGGHSLVRIPGSAVPAASRAERVAATPAGAAVKAVVYLRPRNPGLLRRVAAARSAAPGLTLAQINALFIPRPAAVTRVQRYLESQGLQVTGHDLLALQVAGPAVAQERAFGTGLAQFRASDGSSFRAPTGAVRLPAGIASLVQSVSGLDTALRLQPATAQASRVLPRTVTSNCPGPAKKRSQLFPGAYLPAELGSANGYDHDALINAGADGHSQTIGLVEFSNYKTADVQKFDSCFPAIEPSVSRTSIGGGTTSTSGADEVELDIEVAQAAAPESATTVYIAPNNVSEILPMLSRMVTDHPNVVSDSWGLCEPVLSASFLKSENTALELVAAAGISFYVASGDNGSSDCGAGNGLWVGDPSSQPFATAVGGTTLHTVSKPHSPTTETGWKGSGGGVSENWPMPQWQQSAITAQNDGSKCGDLADRCRETPDVALDANPNTGYMYYCTVSAAVCGSPVGWLAIGGTSAAAPLMAGITADADNSAGVELGFASPFLYSQVHSNVFYDITTGSNNLTGGTKYTAAAGYDMVTGLGSVDAPDLASALHTHGPVHVTAPRTTNLSTTAPAADLSIRYGTRVTFAGTLTDTGGPVDNALVLIQLSNGFELAAITESNGHFSVHGQTQFKQNLSWRAVYLGSDTEAPTITGKQKLYVTPALSAGLVGKRSGGVYHIAVKTSHMFKGHSTPNMRGASVIAQVRSGSQPWHALAGATVSAKGTYHTFVEFKQQRSLHLRWVFSGGRTKHWLTAISPAIAVVVR